MALDETNGDLVLQAQHGDLRARATLTERNRGLVQKVARNYRPEWLTFEDLVQEGMIGLLKAIDRFDPERGCQFSTYAVDWIRQAIGRAIINQDRTIRLPTHVHADPEKRQGAARVTDSLDELVGQNEETPLLALLKDPNAIDPAEVVEEASERAQLWESLAVLSDRERQVIEWRFGLVDGEERSCGAVAPLVGMSREGVRLAEKRSLRKLRAAWKEGMNNGEAIDT